MLNKLLLMLTLLISQQLFTFSQQVKDVKFDDYFSNRTLRFDFNLGGNKNNETVYPVQLKQEPFYGGPVNNLIDYLNYGTYRIVLLDSASGKMIYSRGFSNLFQEWQTTPEAEKVSRTYYQVVTVPFPKNTVVLNIDKREFSTGKFLNIFSMNINPGERFLSKEPPEYFPSVRFRDSGDPAKMVDVAFMADGYTAAEMEKFRNDAKRIGDALLSMKPYSEAADKFNFYAIESVSEESGTDIPGEGIWLNTSLNSSFYTFNSDRYLTTSDLKAVYDAAANVPYDAIIILVNSKKYGGGGFYNQYAESTAGNAYSEQVVIHEFGHSFAGLADEYVGSVNFSDFYNLSLEPWEPNITTNVEFGLKWKNLIRKGTPVPTPRTPEFEDTVGMFEGGGYMSSGIYSPKMDCRMKSNEAIGFCEACEQAIEKMIIFYSGE